MNFDHALQQALAGSSALPCKSNEEIISLLDLTLLDKQATQKDLELLQQKLELYPVAAVCVYSEHLPQIKVPEHVLKATVVNFPQGREAIEIVLREIDTAIRHGAEEIDYVFNYKQFLGGNATAALAHCHQAARYCRQHGLTFKIIVESGAFTEMHTLYSLAQQLLETACDFLKTSTGKTATGATPLAVFTLLRAIKSSNSPCGIKISGGVRTVNEANRYVRLCEQELMQKADKSWLRIGASNLLNELVKA